MSTERTYETSAARIEEIIRRLDSGEASLSETLELMREGKELIEYCARELEAVGGALEELRLEELIARLERDSASTEQRGETSPESAAGWDRSNAGGGHRT